MIILKCDTCGVRSVHVCWVLTTAKTEQMEPAMGPSRLRCCLQSWHPLCTPIQVPAALLPIQLCADGQGGQYKMAQLCLCSHMADLSEAPGLGLAQHWALWPFGESPGRWKILSRLLTCSLSLSLFFRLLSHGHCLSCHTFFQMKKQVI